MSARLMVRIPNWNWYVARLLVSRVTIPAAMPPGYGALGRVPVVVVMGVVRFSRHMLRVRRPAVSAYVARRAGGVIEKTAGHTGSIRPL